VTFLEEGLQIHGMYGEVFEWDSIEDVILMEELPAIVMRTNGSALGSNLKGYFRTKEFGSVKLFVSFFRIAGVRRLNLNGRSYTMVAGVPVFTAIYHTLDSVDGTIVFIGTRFHNKTFFFFGCFFILDRNNKNIQKKN